jgi:hypothetical protein
MFPGSPGAGPPAGTSAFVIRPPRRDASAAVDEKPPALRRRALSLHSAIRRWCARRLRLRCVLSHLEFRLCSTTCDAESDRQHTAPAAGSLRRGARRHSPRCCRSRSVANSSRPRWAVTSLDVLSTGSTSPRSCEAHRAARHNVRDRQRLRGSRDRQRGACSRWRRSFRPAAVCTFFGAVPGVRNGGAAGERRRPCSAAAQCWAPTTGAARGPACCWSGLVRHDLVRCTRSGRQRWRVRHRHPDVTIR